NFQINPAAIIKIKPRKSCGSNLIRIASERGDSLTFHIADGRRVDGYARRKWTNRAGIARHDSTYTECGDALIIPRASPYQTAVAIGVKQTALVALPSRSSPPRTAKLRTG